MTPRDVRLLACDYDRTLTHPDTLALERDTLAAIDEARRAGLRVVAVSGRLLPFMEEHLGGHVDALVAENGCVLRLAPGAPVRCLAPAPVPFRKLLEPLGLRNLELGVSLAAADWEDVRLLEKALGDRARDVAFVRNRDRVMLLPHGMDKAAGFREALREMRVRPEEAAAAGDGENDLPLLEAAGYHIAVANAVPDLKARAHHVTRIPGGAGIAEWIRATWLPARERRARPAPRGMDP